MPVTVIDNDMGSAPSTCGSSGSSGGSFRVDMTHQPDEQSDFAIGKSGRYCERLHSFDKASSSEVA